jgi:peptidoglycan/LPS O-acetylase OafA/YrhL
MNKFNCYGRLSIGDKLDQNRGVGEGFDFLRVFLAVSIVACHSYWVIAPYSDVGNRRETWFQVQALVPMFFALSGFLITGSAQRLHLRDFMINRGLRIIPALAVEILGSAFVLGPIFTALPLRQYFASKQTWHYLTNIVGRINYWLPGVFGEGHLRSNVVNTSLWTIPLEISCYAIMAALIIFALIKRPRSIFIVAILYVFAGLIGQVLLHIPATQSHIPTSMADLIVGRGPPLILFFLVGITAYLYRYKIRYSPLLFGLAIIWCVLAAAFAPLKWIETPAISALICLPIVYIVAFVGVSNISKLPIYHRGDYSYGIYLYGYPIQQAIKTLLPAISNPWVLTAIAIPTVSLFAAFSWHCIEKPILKMRKKFSFIAKIRLSETSQSA